MYKIYIGEKPICLLTEEEAKKYNPKDWTNLLVKHPKQQKKYLLRYIDALERTGCRYQSIIIRTDELQRLWAEFSSYYKILEAAGGVVHNAENKVLAIYRRNFWDLPKGKIDAGETKEQAAIREIQEETGLNELELGRFITSTYHTYRDRKRERVIKISHWFKVSTKETDLIPQTEEDIEKAVWVDLEHLKKETAIYPNILEVLNQV